MGTDMVRIAVVEHQESCPPGLFGTWLAEAGCELDVVRPYRGDALPEPDSHDALLVLGGEMSANDDETVPWLAPLKSHIRASARAGTPVLGICLGHQLMAVALGGTVAPSRHGQMVGVQPVGWTSAAAEDLLFAGCTGAERVIHWNDDVVTQLPGEAVELAASPRGDHQVVRYGQRAWGIQAHPEADVGIVARWAESDRARHVAAGIDQEAVLAEVVHVSAALQADWRPFVLRFVEIARTRSRG